MGRQRSLDRPVAIKILSGALAEAEGDYFRRTLQKRGPGDGQAQPPGNHLHLRFRRDSGWTSLHRDGVHRWHRCLSHDRSRGAPSRFLQSYRIFQCGGTAAHCSGPEVPTSPSVPFPSDPPGSGDRIAYEIPARQFCGCRACGQQEETPVTSTSPDTRRRFWHRGGRRRFNCASDHVGKVQELPFCKSGTAMPTKTLSHSDCPVEARKSNRSFSTSASQGSDQIFHLRFQFLLGSDGLQNLFSEGDAESIAEAVHRDFDGSL